MIVRLTPLCMNTSSNHLYSDPPEYNSLSLFILEFFKLRQFANRRMLLTHYSGAYTKEARANNPYAHAFQ